MRRLVGRRVSLTLTPPGGGATVSGRVTGSLESADGLVVFVEPDGEPGGRVTVHHQHVERFEEKG